MCSLSVQSFLAPPFSPDVIRDPRLGLHARGEVRATQGACGRGHFFASPPPPSCTESGFPLTLRVVSAHTTARIVCLCMGMRNIYAMCTGWDPVACSRMSPRNNACAPPSPCSMVCSMLCCVPHIYYDRRVCFVHFSFPIHL